MKLRPQFSSVSDARHLRLATSATPTSTAAACILIFEHTNWDIRLLSKSHRLADLVLKMMIPEKYHHRLILGFSTGTLDDKLAAAIEGGTSLVSKRIAALHALQDLGIRTFGMICPSLPYGTQEDYDEFSRNMCEVLRIERCEHVWAEVINLRGDSLTATVAALRDGGFETEAQRLEAVSGPGPKNTWETYARMTFDAHAKHIPANKFRFLQYVTAKSASCWKGERQNGAVLLGSYAEANSLITIDTSAPSGPLPDLEEGDIRYREEREEIVTSATKINLCASEALWQIMTYKDGLLWRKDFQTFVKYCRSRWGCEKSHAYRHLKIGGFLARLENGDSPIGENRPQNESQVRLLLTKVPEEHQVDCWKSIVAKVPASELSARIVATETGKYLKKKGLDEKAVNTPKPDHRLKARLRAKRELNSLKAILGKLPFPARFEQLLYGIESLIEQEPQTEVGQAEITAVDPAPPHDPALATSDSAS
jgi:DNA repair photolyase